MKEEFQQFGDPSRPTAERSAILVSAATVSSASSASSSTPAAAAALSGERERRLLGTICENDDGDPVAQRLVSLTTSAFTQMDSMLLPGERGSGSRDENDPLPDTETSTAASSTRPAASRPATVNLAASEPQPPGPVNAQPAVAGPPPPDPTTLQFGFGMLVTRECTKYVADLFPYCTRLLVYCIVASF